MQESNRRRNAREDYPLTLKVSEVADILRVDLHKAYKIIRREGFPAIVDGRRIIIPRDAFFKWLDNSGQVHLDFEHLDQILNRLADLVVSRFKEEWELPRKN